MNTTFKIMKNELTKLFCSPIAWIVLVIFFFHCGSSFCEAIEPNLRWKAQGYDLETLTFDLFVGYRGLFKVMLDKIFMYFPLLTMGILSKEYSDGSIYLLFSSPISNRKIVWGKYLALVVFSLTFIAIFALFIIYSRMIVPDLDMGMVLAGLLGFFLLCCAYSAIGLFMSSLTSYQVVAAIGTFAVFALLNNIGSFGQEYPLLREITYWFSLNNRTSYFVYGMIRSEDVIYFLVIIAMFLSLTLTKLHYDRTKRSTFVKVGRYLAIIAVAVAIGYVSSRPKMMGYCDLTATKSNTLTPASQEIMKQLDGPMTITSYVNLMDKSVYYGLPRNFKNDTKMFDNYRRFKPEIKLKYVYYYHDCDNPQLDVRFPNQPDVDERAKIIAKGYRLKLESFLTPGQIDSLVDLSGEEYFFTREISYNGKSSFIRMFDDMQQYPSEAEITAAMRRLNDKNPPVLAFAAGNGERSIYKKGDRDFYTFGRNIRMRHALENQGFNSIELDLETVETVPDNILALILGDPQRPYSEHALGLIKDYISRGGNMVIAASEESREFLNPVAAELGLIFLDGIIVKEQEQNSPEFLVCNISPGAGSISPNYQYLKSRGFQITSPRSIPLGQFENKGYTFYPVFNTDSTGCWIEKTTKDFIDDVPVFEPEKGDMEWNNQPLMVGAVRQVGDKTQKIIVLSNAECVSNSELGISRKGISAANFYLVLEPARWFTDGQYPVNVGRPKGKDNVIKTNYDKLGLHKAVFVWFFPLLMVAIGAWIVIRRQRK
ncbi:MAG: Gldg family protein [Bacteroidales bacterium]|nr:Gldg family protein [Bacteroidales bacterium]